MRYTYTFDQLRWNEAGIEAMFMPYDWAQRHGGVDTENYFTEDSGTIKADTPLAACERLYRIYNIDHPSGYIGRSMSVSDIVNLWDNEQDPPVQTSWYCDSIGFVQIDGKGRECLNAEWIDHKKAYRLYRPYSEKDTVAYIDSLSEVDDTKYALLAVMR